MKYWMMTFSLVCALNYSLQAIDVSVHISRYQQEGKPYIEVFYYISNSTVGWLDSAKSQKKVQVTMLLYRQDVVTRYDKFEITNTASRPNDDFMTLQRYALEAGDYKVVFTCTDESDSSNVRTQSATVHINSAKQRPTLSDIIIYSEARPVSDVNTGKHGVFYEQFPNGYVNPDWNSLGFMTELYHTDMIPGPQTYVLLRVKGVGDTHEGKVKAKIWMKRKPKAFDIIKSTLDVSYYESGYYELMLAIADSTHHIIDSAKYVFIKSNPAYDARIIAQGNTDAVATSFAGKLSNTEVIYSLKAILMNVPFQDINMVSSLINSGNATAGATYLYNYYKKLSPVFTDAYYTQYMEVAKAVDQKYKIAGRFGFESERGIIFMKYGKPNDIVSIMDDPSAPPYEIWLYHSIPQIGQSNVKFLFYNPNLDGADYRLLTSNARGERQDKDWKKELYKSAYKEIPANTSPDKWDIGEGINRHAAELMEDL
jgi:GWxTD domain-containing protein